MPRIKLPQWLVNQIDFELSKGPVKVTIVNPDGRESGLTFSQDGYWYGLANKIHINYYIRGFMTYCYKDIKIKINGKLLSDFIRLELPHIKDELNESD